MQPESILRIISGKETTDAAVYSNMDFYLRYDFCPINYKAGSLQKGWTRLRTLGKIKAHGDEGDTVKILSTQPVKFIDPRNNDPKRNKTMEGWTEESYRVPDGMIIHLQPKIERRKFGSRSNNTAMFIRTRLSGALQSIRFTEETGLPPLVVGYFDVLSADFMKEQNLAQDSHFRQHIGDMLRDEFITIDIVQKAQYDIEDMTTKIIKVEGAEIAIRQRRRKRSVKL